MQRIITTLAAALLLAGCVSTTITEDSTEVRTFGASTVTILGDGTVETHSPGFSEGFVQFLVALPEAALRILAGMFGGFAPAPTPVIR